MDKKYEINEENNYIKDYKFGRSYKEELDNLNIFTLFKSDSLIDKKKALELLIKYFNDLDCIIDKYEILIRISKDILPLLLNISTPSYSSELKLTNFELYISTGKFLLQFLYNKEFILDFSDFIHSDNISKKFPCLLFYNKSELININELDNKRYHLLSYDIINKYRSNLINLYIKYYIKPIIINDMNFEIQYIIFEMLKYFYFICDDVDSRNILSKYISEVLNNLSQFKKQTEYDKALYSREFGYYLMLHEDKFKSLSNSITISPKNEYDVYTTKFNVAKDLINKVFYLKKELETGKSFEILENLYKKHSILYLEFYIEDNREICLTLYKKNENDNNFEKIGFNNIIKTMKMDEKDENNENQITYNIAKVIVINSSNSLNEFKIVIDNYDSWFTKRIIHYSISIFEKTE